MNLTRLIYRAACAGFLIFAALAARLPHQLEGAQFRQRLFPECLECFRGPLDKRVPPRM